MEQQHHLADLAIDPVGAEQIRGIATWGKFLSIIGFIVCALVLLGGIFAGTFFSTMGNMGGMEGYGGAMSGMGTILTVVYIILAIVYFIPTLFLYQASTKLKTAININDQGLMNEGLTKLKACFRFWGILTIVIISLYLLAIIFGGMAAMMGN